MWLQLADGVQDAVNPYVLIPDPSGRNRGMYVREDHFDYLSNSDFNRMMRNLAPFQKSVQSGQLSESEFLADKRARKEKRTAKTEGKTVKKKAKGEKKTLKNEKRKANIDIKKAKAEKKRSTGRAKETRAEGKRLRGEGKAQGGRAPGEDEEENEARGAKFFSAVKNVGGKLLNKYTGGGGGSDAEEEESSSGGSGKIRKKVSAETDSEEKPFYKKPVVIGVGLGLLALGIGYVATRPRKVA